MAENQLSEEKKAQLEQTIAELESQLQALHNAEVKDEANKKAQKAVRRNLRAAKRTLGIYVPRQTGAVKATTTKSAERKTRKSTKSNGDAAEAPAAKPTRKPRKPKTKVTFSPEEREAWVALTKAALTESAGLTEAEDFPGGEEVHAFPLVVVQDEYGSKASAPEDGVAASIEAMLAKFQERHGTAPEWFALHYEGEAPVIGFGPITQVVAT